MRVALVTTTINVPHAIAAFRACEPATRFYVAGDLKTPSEARDFCVDQGCDYLSPAKQKSLGYKCSEPIGFSSIARRNIALLEALKDGAEAVYFWDDDNLLVSPQHFHHIGRALFSSYPGPIKFNGLQATSPSNWFDVGQLLDPIAPHRGFPHVKRGETTFVSAVGRRVGVAAGICLGDPDISAVSRIANAPIVHRVSELLRAGIVVDPTTTWTVFNSQNTAIIRELAPAFFMVPQWGRYDDIFASLMVQRLMRERGLVTHFGQPFVWQQRNAHDLLRDLRAEQFGAERILDFTDWLDGFIFTGKEAVADCMRVMFTNLPDWMPERGKIQEMVLAWCDDCDSVMK